MKSLIGGIIWMLFFVPVATYAYVPKFWHIMSRTAENHGRGIYRINQDVILLGEAEPLTLHETWTVESENSMRLDVTGRGKLAGAIQLTFIYDGTARYFVDKSGQKKAVRPSSDWHEPYFQFRFSKNIKPIMKAHNMIPASALERPGRLRSIEEIKHDPQDFVRLARVGGTVAYGIGTPTPANATENLPGLWIEQDKFVVTKLRLPSQLEVTASNYVRHTNDFWLPSIREMSWPGHQARIRVTDVKPLGYSKTAKGELNPRILDDSKNRSQLAAQWPEDTLVQDFYNRFR